MARKKRFPRLSGEQAHAALTWLHAVGKVTASDIENAVKRRERLVEEIKRKLEQLGGGSLRFLRGPEGLKRSPAKRRRRASAKTRAARGNIAFGRWTA